MVDACDDTSVSAIGKRLVELSWTERKPTLFGFDYDLSNKSILNKSALDYQMLL